MLRFSPSHSNLFSLLKGNLFKDGKHIYLFSGTISFFFHCVLCVLSVFVFSPPCWFSAAVLQRTLCVWHKLSRTVPVKYKKLHTHIREVSHKNRTHFTYNIHKKYRKNTPLRYFTKNFVCVCTN